MGLRHSYGHCYGRAFALLVVFGQYRDRESDYGTRTTLADMVGTTYHVDSPEAERPAKWQGMLPLKRSNPNPNNAPGRLCHSFGLTSTCSRDVHGESIRPRDVEPSSDIASAHGERPFR